MNITDTQRTWSDEQLANAIRASANWRAVARQLGVKSTSAGAIRIVRRRAAELALDTSHFRGMRRWSDARLRSVISSASTWDEVLTALGLSARSGNARPFIKSHAIRLGLDCSHLVSHAPPQPEHPALRPDRQHLREAGPVIAATWFALCGCAVSFPVEPATFDLLVSTGDGIKRVQVKTTTSRGKEGWQASVGRRPYTPNDLGRLAPYDPGDIDYFFVVDGDLTMYLIPTEVIAGRVGILLRAYKDYIVGDAKRLVT